MISLLPSAALGIREGQNRSRAIFLASQRLEQVRHAVGRSGPDTDPLAVAGAAFPDEPALPAPDAEFSRSVRVVDCGLPHACSSAQTAGLREVLVTVGYPGTASDGFAGVRGAVVLATYVAAR